jgi:hypothetical protein
METGFILAYTGIALISLIVVVFLIIPELTKLYYHSYRNGIKGNKKYEELSEKEQIEYLKIKYYNDVFDRDDLLEVK